MNKNGLSRIDPAAFDGPLLDTLTELNLDMNQLGSVPQVGVSRLKSLRKLILKNNQIAVLPPRAFAAYESASVIEKVDLSENQLSGIGTISLEGLLALKEITFETNMFTSIPSQGLRVVRQTLEDLNLGLNKISDVPVGALDFPNLKSLSLEFNNIQYIQPESFRAIPNLLFMYIGGNKFARFDPNLYRYVPKLEILGIGDTNIQLLPRDSFKFTPRLRQLEMSDAAVNRIEDGAFQRIRDTIQRIVLNKNELTRIGQDTFKGLNQLQSLDLEGNLLSKVDNGAWVNLPNLAHLDISNNRLMTLESRTFENTFLPTLETRTLYVCGNPWVCDQRLEWFREWLRRELSIYIDKPPSCLAECAKPDFLNRWPLRELDPTPITQAPIIQRAAAISSIGWIILAIILAILLTSIMLLGLVRWFLGRRRRQDKEKEEEERILRSSAVHSAAYRTGPGSMIGSGYPASAIGYPVSMAPPPLDLDLPPAHSLQDVDKTYW